MATKNDRSAKHVIDEDQYNFLKEMFWEFMENGYSTDIKIITSKDVNYVKKVHSVILQCFCKLFDQGKNPENFYNLNKRLSLHHTTDMIECMLNLLYFGKCIVPVTALPQFADLAKTLKISQISVYDERGSDYFIYLMYHKQKLLDYLCYIKKNEINCDMNIVSLEFKCIPVHSCILAAYSNKFFHCFKNRLKEANPVLLFIPLKAEIIELTLELCYYGQVTFEKSCSNALLEVASILGMARFLEKCKLTRKKYVLNEEVLDFRLVKPPVNSKPEIVDKIKKNNSQHYVYMWTNNICHIFPFLCIQLLNFLNNFDELKKNQFDIIIFLKNISNTLIKKFILALYSLEFKDEIKILVDLFGLKWPTIEKDIPSSESYMTVENEVVPNTLYASKLDDLRSICDMVFEHKCNKGEKIIQVFTCQTCGQQFLSCTAYKSHCKEHQSSGYLCEECGQFVRPNLFLDHSARHKALKKYECKNCTKQFPNAYALKKHQKSSCIVGNCPICNKRIGKLKINQHIANHSLAFRCSHCKQNLRSSQWLKRHLIYQTLEKPVSCAHCRKTFGFKCQLNKHIRKEHMPVSCSICSQSFTSKGMLGKHFTIKHAKDPIKCCVCDKAFTTLPMLKVHERCHSGEEPFSNETFGKFDQMQYRIQQVDEKRKFICPICDKDYVSKNYFSEHGLINQQTHFDSDLCIKKESVNLPLISQEIANANNGSNNKMHNFSEHGLINQQTIFDSDLCIKKESVNLPLISQEIANSSNGSNNKMLLENDIDYQTWLANKTIIIYNCPICKKEFKNFSDLILHLDTHL